MAGKPNITRKSSRDGTLPKPLTLPKAAKKVRHRAGANKNRRQTPSKPFGGQGNYYLPGVSRDQVGPKTGMKLPALPGHTAEYMEKILHLKNILEGKENVLFVGAGKSGEAWRDYCNDDTLVVAANSTIMQLADRANIFLCTEGNGYEMAWYFTESKALRVVSYCNLKRPHIPAALRSMEIPDQIPIERGWHLAGFNPREYFNPKLLPDERFNDPMRNWYNRYRTYIGCDRHTRREWGLLKGPVCYPGNMSIGTVYVNGLHLLAYMGADRIRSIGFDLCQKEGLDHWNQPTFKYKPSRWSPPECFVKINGMPTLWHFALSAAYALKLRPVFEEAGVQIEDHSDGLMQLPGIERLMTHINDQPRDFDLGASDAKKVGTVREESESQGYEGEPVGDMQCCTEQEEEGLNTVSEK